ncbi:hypothetical protein WA026_001548 [Henosepilachna vigintioctopunctata]|uniref:Uncharacterized protein n=1 Tax=Henosepilachna vigintioctopunctata TaxID=420089 RepID=A0AAW1UIE3_9CUCU
MLIKLIMRENKRDDMAAWAQDEEPEVTIIEKPLMIDKATDTYDINYFKFSPCKCRIYDSEDSILRHSTDFSQKCQCERHGTKTFLDAAFTGNFDLLQICLDHDVNVHAFDHFGDTALHMVSGRGDFTMLKFLLNLEPPLNINAQNGEGLTPLSLAVIGSHNKCVKLLLEKGANPNIGDKNGKSPLAFSVADGNTYLSKLLLHQGANVNTEDSFGNTPLVTALIDKPLIEMLHVLLSSGANPAFKNNRLTPFLEAVLDCTTYEKLEAIKILVNHGTNVNVVDGRSHRNCLHLAAINGFLPLAEYLVNSGANLEQLDTSRRNPHQVAFEHNNNDVGDFFLKAMCLKRVFYKKAMIRKYGKKRKFTLVEIFTT